jgi:signal transduction histidine kinase
VRLLQRRLQRGDEGTATEEPDLAVGELEGTLAELRRIAHGVRPGRLDDGLAPALEAVRAACPVPLAMAVHDLPELDDTRALTAYLVVSEAVTNAGTRPISERA